ncbi:MAG: dephospho-CoA kinase [Gammaproteobacteria bacterium]|nr:dephospho-CoA kinase [Gammaproteobacteria bacterium]MYF02796.1 dephospho-CoA kinase [Gammaproteobacteria bacterium]MYI77742.1 dephospho-CoA kinase [Gammaproteobacteria bacterium]
MYTIGLTGSIGAGKSTVARYLEQRGYPVIDADRLGHEAYLPNTSCYQQVVRVFGDEVVAEDGTIDRKTLGNIVFADLTQLQCLNEIVWPAIKQLAILRFQQTTDDQDSPIAFFEAAVLVEANWHMIVDEVWTVLADETSVVQRVMKRDHTTELQLKQRLKAQISIDERVRWSSVVINNDASIEELYKAIDQQLISLHLRIEGGN